MKNESAKEVALWRYQVIAPLLSLSGPRGTLQRAIRRLSEQYHQHPLHGPVHLGFGTIEQWYYLYKHHGFEGLFPKTRADHGKSRRIDADLAEKIEALARGRPELDGPGILKEIKAQLQDQRALPSLSTLYRFLRAHGLDQRRAPLRRDHRAYSFDLPGDCWQGDVMYGPSLPLPDGSRRKTYLIAILDDATRLIAHAQFYFEQHLRSLKDCLKQALQKRGLPRRLYFDNGRVFKSRLVLQLAARLGIQLIHSRPFRPQGRAKVERWFGTVRRGFLARLDLKTVTDLDHLNRLLFAWIEGEYHVTAHRGLEGEVPLDRWVRLSEGLRPLPQNLDLDELFLEETTRRVAKDGTFTLKGRTFEAGPLLIGERVLVLFDPFDLRRVYIKRRNGEKLQASPIDREANRRVRRNPDPEPQGPPPPLRALHDLAEEMERDDNPLKEKETDYDGT